MVSISLCMIVKNEEKNLEACLSSVTPITDEIIIVDTGSNDNTVELAKQYTDKIYVFNWVNDFSKARNFSFSKATKDYILWLDADDTITPLNRNKLLALKESLSFDIDYINMLYHYSHYESGEVAVAVNRERLVKRSAGFKWVYPVHEALMVSGKYLDSDIYITHNHTDGVSTDAIKRNLDILEKSVEAGDRSIRTRSYLALSLYNVGRFDEALSQIEIILKHPENSGSMLSSLGIFYAAHDLYLKKGDYEAALNVLLCNKDLMADKAEYYCNLGAFYYNRKGDPREALKYFRRALLCGGKEAGGELARRNEEYYYFEPLRSIGNCYIKLRRFNKALEYFKRALEYRPGDELTRDVTKKLERMAALKKN